MKFFSEITECFNQLAEDANCRVIILSGAGKSFCAGIFYVYETNCFLKVIFSIC